VDTPRDPNHVFRPGDSLLAIYSCYGGGKIIMVWQVCWMVP